VFTSGGTEADNAAILGVMQARSVEGRDHLVICATEHPAVLAAADAARRRLDVRVTVLPVDEFGALRPGALEDAVDDRTALVSIMMANNEIGTVAPVTQLAEIAHQRGALFHTDAVQALGKIDVKYRDLGVDLLSISGHKVHGLKGTGALIVGKECPFDAMVLGGGQERGRRGGTHNVVGIVALGTAVRQAVAEQPAEAVRLASLRDALWSELSTQIPNIRRNGSPDGLPNTLNISIPGLDGEGLLIALDGRGLAVSSGSACSSGARTPSHVLTALGGEDWRVDCALRISLGRESTVEMVTSAATIIVDEVQRMAAQIGSRTPGEARRSR